MRGVSKHPLTRAHRPVITHGRYSAALRGLTAHAKVSARRASHRDKNRSYRQERALRRFADISTNSHGCSPLFTAVHLVFISVHLASPVTDRCRLDVRSAVFTIERGCSFVFTPATAAACSSPFTIERGCSPPFALHAERPGARRSRRCSALFVVERRCSTVFTDRRPAATPATVVACSAVFTTERRCSSLFALCAERPGARRSRRCSPLFVRVRECPIRALANNRESVR